MITCFAFGKKLEKLAFDKESLQKAIKSRKKIWIDISHPKKEDFLLLQDLFELHPITVEDCFTNNSRTKIEIFDDDYLFYVLHAVRRKKGIVFHEVDLVLGKKFIITSHQTELIAIDKLLQNTTKLGVLMKQGIDVLFHNIIDAEIDRYFPVLEQLDDEIEDLDVMCLRDPSREVLVNLNQLRTMVMEIRRKAYRQRDKLIYLTRNDTPFLSDDVKLYFRDVYDNSVRIADFIDAHRETVVGTLDTYLSLMSNKMNDVMRVLTIMATIMMPLTVISSIYGMNFAHMPELNWRYGYYVVLGFMAFISATMIYFFKKRKWV